MYFYIKIFSLSFPFQPQLPAYVVCNVCDSRDEGNLLMECHVCSEVVHPACMEESKRHNNLSAKKKKLLTKCKISKKVNNSWECPKCCQSDDDVSFRWKISCFCLGNRDFKLILKCYDDASSHTKVYCFCLGNRGLKELF